PSPDIDPSRRDPTGRHTISLTSPVSTPRLGNSLTQGTTPYPYTTLFRSVEVDEPLLEVSTDKVDTEIPSPVAGVLTKILVDEDETVDIGAEIALIGGEGEEESDTDDSSAQEPATEPEPAAEPTAEPEPEPAAPSPPRSDSSGPATSVSMPGLGESVTEGTVTQWLKNVADTAYTTLFRSEVSTDKVDTEIPSPVAGVLTKILVDEDETVDIGAEIALIGGERSEERR